VPDAQTKESITRWQRLYYQKGFDALLAEASKTTSETSIEIVVKEAFLNNGAQRRIFLVDTSGRGWFVRKGFVRINPDNSRQKEEFWTRKVRLIFGAKGQVTEAINL